MRRAFAVSAYVRFSGTILLVSHVKQAAWVPIGGEIEANETPTEALMREVEEEIGWRRDYDYTLGPSTEPGVPNGLLAYEEHDARSKGLHMNFAFLLHAHHTRITPCDEFTKVAWVQRYNDVDPVPENVRYLVQKALASV